MALICRLLASSSFLTEVSSRARASARSRWPASASFRHLQYFGVSGGEKCGTFFDLLPRRGKLAGERLAAGSLFPKRLLLFAPRRLSESCDLRACGTQRLEFRLQRGQLSSQALRPLSFLLEFLLEFLPQFLLERLLLLHLCRGGLRDFRTHGPRGIEFSLERGNVTREAICPAPLPFECLPLFELRFGSLHASQVDIDPRRIELARKRIRSVSLLIQRLPLLDCRRFSR
jgi:hypothetical protein